MKIQNRLLPIVLCGGTGSRLWPLSRKSFPKQYLKIDPKNNYSFLQTTLNRIKELKNICNPIIVCNEEHRFITAEQIRAIKIRADSILLEPCSRNTAPAIAIAAIHSLGQGYDPTLLIIPSDHQIKNDFQFLEPIKKAEKFVNPEKIILFGIRPQFPSTAYGYIKANEKLTVEDFIPRRIEEFIEKPDQTLANKFCKDDSFTWNSGIFMMKASTIINELRKYSPEIISHCEDSLKK